jgi:hypothetical protein
MSKDNKTEKLSPTEAVIEILAEVRDRDPEAFAKLVELRIDVNEKLAMHPGIPTRAQRGKHQMGLVSILNGMLSMLGESKIASIVEDDEIIGFTASPVKHGSNGLNDSEILPASRAIAVG